MAVSEFSKNLSLNLAVKGHRGTMQLQLLDAHPAGFTDAAYVISDDIVHIATCGKDGNIAVRPAEKAAETAKKISTTEEGAAGNCPLNRLAVSPNGDRIAVADETRFVKVRCR